MKKDHISNYKKGWLVGNFDPSLIHSTDIEVGIHLHKKDEKEDLHIHKLSTEYNLIIQGKVVINGVEFNDGDIFVVEPYMIIEARFIEDTKILVIKTPSIPNDKYKIEIN